MTALLVFVGAVALAAGAPAAFAVLPVVVFAARALALVAGLLAAYVARPVVGVAARGLALVAGVLAALAVVFVLPSGICLIQGLSKRIPSILPSAFIIVGVTLIR